MGLSLNPVDFVRLFRDSRAADRIRVTAWLETVREEAEELSTAWFEISLLLERPEMDEVSTKRMLENFGKNGRYYTRLREFYDYASRALGTTVNKRLRDEFFAHLGSALCSRDITRSEADKMAALLRSRDFNLLDTDSEFKAIKSVKDAAQVLQSELAALDVFITTVKALPDSAFR
jgi:hypothetical protein